MYLTVGIIKQEEIILNKNITVYYIDASKVSIENNVSGKITGNLVIDSKGNIYLATSNAVYALNNANQLWNYTQKFDGSFYGVAISRDVIVVPENGNTIHFINQTTGEKFGKSNIYQGSSFFAPVVTSDATLYIVSEYQYTSEDYKITIIPYKLWANGGDPTLVTIGNTKPLCSPTLNENIIVIISDNRLRLIDAKTLDTISIKSGNFQPTRPVIGEGNIVYSILLRQTKEILEKIDSD